MANSIPFYGPVDLQKNELQNARLQNLGSAPAVGAGLVYYDTGSKTIGVSDGSVWTYLATADGALDPTQVHDIVANMLSGSSQIVSTYNSGNGTIVLTIANGAIKNANIASDAAISADKIAAGSTNSVYTVTEKTKLAGIASGATANSSDATLLARANHTGTQSADTIVDGSSNKVFTTADNDKLDGIAAQATKNQTDSYLLNRTNHTGTQTADTITDGSTNKAYTATEQTKLAGITTGATANQTDAYLTNRANHTGTQTASTISDFTTAVNSIVQSVVGAAPAALDTLQELAAALGNDANFATNIAAQISQKADLSALATVAKTGLYNDLSGKPTYTTTIGDGTTTDFVITHNLGTRFVSTLVYTATSPYSVGMVPTENTSNTTTTLHFGTPPAAGSLNVKISAA